MPEGQDFLPFWGIFDSRGKPEELRKKRLTHQKCDVEKRLTRILSFSEESNGELFAFLCTFLCTTASRLTSCTSSQLSVHLLCPSNESNPKEGAAANFLNFLNFLNERVEGEAAVNESGRAVIYY